jgi:dipeptidyl aminopeptidase/acylaminoacyl peptidase
MNFVLDIMKVSKSASYNLFLQGFLFFSLVLSVSAQPLSVRDIMAEPSLAGMRPEGERLSPDGKFVVYLWNADGKEPRDLFLIPTTGGTSRILVKAVENADARTEPPENPLNYGLVVRDDFVKSRERPLGNIAFSPESRRLLFTQGGDLYILNFQETNAKPKRITRTQGFEGAAQWLDERRVMYQTGGNLFVITLDDTALVQLSKEANPAAFVSVSGAEPTENGALVAYVVSDGSKQRALAVPNYVDEYVTATTVRRGLTEQKLLVVKSDGSLEKPLEIALPKPEGAAYIRSLNWMADNKTLIVDRVDRDTKRRQIFLSVVGDQKADTSVLLAEETDTKWIAPLSRIVEPAPIGNRVIFASERDGFNHLYLATFDPAKFAGGRANPEIKQLTAGKWEVSWAKWRKNGTDIVFSSTEMGTAERRFYTLNLSTDKKAELPNEKGLNTEAQLSYKYDPKNDQTILLFKNSQWNQPSDLYAMRVCPECRGLNPAKKLTNTVPDKFKAVNWTEPKFIEFPAQDGKSIKAKIYLPPQFDKTKKYPMVVFVHGAGYLQNIINGWNNYYREFMFNHLLTQKDYIVLDIDYRGSAGYGRDFRTDVYDFLGGLDLQDHLDGIDYAVKNYSADIRRVGIYGGSYGGFIAEMAVMRAPEKIACAAALRPVADWKNYFTTNPIYTMERLGYPDKNAEAYKRSSPISYADKLQQPLLILHGLADDNVHAQDSMQLIEKLIRLNKTQYFESMFYPTENHGFVRPESWTDEYERILAFFEKHLK